MEKNNQLVTLVNESQLEPSQAKHILEQFQDYFEIAAEWEQKAKTIVVTKDTQVAEMEMARSGRLFLRAKRIAVENVRKKLKEQALREGKAIDGIANVLKALMIPIEEYFDKQEHFVKIKEDEKREAMRLEVEKRIEDDRIAKERADAEERERIRIENVKLKEEADLREWRLSEERRLHDESIAKERAKADAEKRVMEDRARQDREAAEKKLREEREKAEAEKKKAEEKARKEKAAADKKAEAERKEKERLAELLKNQVECPFCHKIFHMKVGMY